MVPARLLVVDHLPTTANGKLDEEGLRLIAKTAPPPSEESEAIDLHNIEDPRVRQVPEVVWDPVEDFVLECARAILGNGLLGLDDDLWAAGLDSLSAIELLDTINGGDYGRFDTPEFMGLATAAQLARALHETPVTTDASVAVSSAVTLNPGGGARPVFAIPGTAGTSARFTHLARGLGADQPLVVIGPSGMHRPGRVHRTIEEMAGHACVEIEARLDPGDVCVLLGYSAGGSVGFEAARELDARGFEVRLVILDAIPGLAGGEQVERIRPLKPVAQRPSFRLRVRQRGVVATVRRLPAALRSRRRVKHMDRLHAQPGPPSFDHDRYQVFAQIQSDAVEAYQPEASQLKATLIRVDQGQIELLAEGLFEHLDVHVVGGNHYTMLDQLHAPEVVEVLRPIIDAPNS
jgi:thioesterase domain-containing protein